MEPPLATASVEKPEKLQQKRMESFPRKKKPFKIMLINPVTFMFHENVRKVQYIYRMSNTSTSSSKCYRNNTAKIFLYVIEKAREVKQGWVLKLMLPIA